MKTFSKKRESLHFMNFRASGDVKDLLNPLFLTVEPQWSENTKNMIGVSIVRNQNIGTRGMSKRRVPKKHRGWSHQLLKVLNMESIYWKHEMEVSWFFNSAEGFLIPPICSAYTYPLPNPFGLYFPHANLFDNFITSVNAYLSSSTAIRACNGN